MNTRRDDIIDLHAFARGLRRGKVRHARPVEIEALLVWLTRGSKRAPLLTDELGTAGEDTNLLERIFALLDRTLFDAGALRPSAAGVGAGVSEFERQARYRQLMAAFHPDRFPQLGVWLTPRSQAIHQAYADFKKRRRDPESGVDAGRNGRGPARTGDAGSKRRGREPWGAASYGRSSGLLERMRRRFGGARAMPQKILLAVLLLALVPVLLLYFSQMPREPVPEDAPETAAVPASAPPAPPDALNWSIPAFTGAGVPDQVTRTDTFPFPDMLPLRLRGRVRWEFGQSVDIIERSWVTSRAIVVPMLVALGVAESDAEAADLAPRFMLSNLLTSYIDAIESQDLERLIRLLSATPSQDGNQGRVWFREHYAALFYQAKAIDLSLNVIDAERSGENWLLDAIFEQKILYQSLDTETRRGRVRYTISPVAGDWRIAAINY